MKSRRILFSMIIFLIGIFVGFSIVVLAGLAANYLDPGTLLTARPKTSGDIKVWVQKSKAIDDVKIPEGFYPEHSKELWMTKDNIPFLMISQNETCKTVGLYLLAKSKLQPIFFMTPTEIPGEWSRATYSKSSASGKPAGDVYVDINFDGWFDCKLALGGDGELSSRYIYLDNSWVEIDYLWIRKKSARAGPTEYAFTPESGWQKK